MCEYCDLLSGDYKYLNDEVSEISIVRHFNTYTLETDNYEELEINYCPICGRDLKNDKNVKSANNYLPDKLKAEVDRLNKITNKLEEENELRKKHLAGEAHKLITDMRIIEDTIEYRQKFWEELDRQKMLDLFERRKM